MTTHHKGICRGGPYNGQLKDYFQSTMPVLTFLNSRDSGEYLFEPHKEGSDEGTWFWRGLTTK